MKRSTIVLAILICLLVTFFVVVRALRRPVVVHPPKVPKTEWSLFTTDELMTMKGAMEGTPRTNTIGQLQDGEYMLYYASPTTNGWLAISQGFEGSTAFLVSGERTDMNQLPVWNIREVVIGEGRSLQNPLNFPYYSISTSSINGISDISKSVDLYFGDDELLSSDPFYWKFEKSPIMNSSPIETGNYRILAGTSRYPVPQGDRIVVKTIIQRDLAGIWTPVSVNTVVSRTFPTVEGCINLCDSVENCKTFIYSADKTCVLGTKDHNFDPGRLVEWDFSSPLPHVSRYLSGYRLDTRKSAEMPSGPFTLKSKMGPLLSVAGNDEWWARKTIMYNTVQFYAQSSRANLFLLHSLEVKGRTDSKSIFNLLSGLRDTLWVFTKEQDGYAFFARSSGNYLSYTNGLTMLPFYSSQFSTWDLIQ